VKRCLWLTILPALLLAGCESGDDITIRAE